MKKLFATLILSILLIGGLNAQTGGVAIGNATVWTDSLGYGEVAASDSVWILNVGFANEWYRIFLEGNANSSVDSVAVQTGSVRYNEAKTAVDTVWGSYTGVKIAAGTYVVRMVNTSLGADFILDAPPIQLLKFSLMNHRASLTTRNVTITINATRK